MRSKTSKFSDSRGLRRDMIGCISSSRLSVACGPDRRATMSSSAARWRKASAPLSYTTRPSPAPVLASRQARSAVDTASFMAMPGATSIRPTEPRTWKALSPTR